MKKFGIIGSISVICLACTFTSVFAASSGYRTVTTYSNSAVEMATGTKSTNESRTGASLSAIGGADTIDFWANDADNYAALTSFYVRESSTASAVTSSYGYYTSGVSGASGRRVKVIGRSREFSITGFPINVNVNFY